MADDFRHRRATALWQEGQSHQLDGDLERAAELYTQSIAVHPTAEAHTFRGWAWSRADRLEDAIRECEIAIELDPDFGNAYNDLGSYLIRLGRPDEAIAWLTRAKVAVRYEARHFPFINLGHLFARKGMILRAIREFEGALALVPGDETCLRALERLKERLQ